MARDTLSGFFDSAPVNKVRHAILRASLKMTDAICPSGRTPAAHFRESGCLIGEQPPRENCDAFWESVCQDVS
jgi:hypothetical protein